MDDEGIEVLKREAWERELQHHPMRQESELYPFVRDLAVQIAQRRGELGEDVNMTPDCLREGISLVNGQNSNHLW
eukprot:scaffold1878_cov169-Ochromonas_danica.AAC.1